MTESPLVNAISRWNNTPHSEASGFGHQKLVVYLRDFMLSHPEQLQTDYSAYADDFPPEPDVQGTLARDRRQGDPGGATATLLSMVCHVFR